MMAIQTRTATLKLLDDSVKSLGVGNLTPDLVTSQEGLIEGIDFAIDRPSGTIRRLKAFGRELYTFICRYDDLSEQRAAEQAALLADEQAAQTAKIAFRGLPNWATWTGAQVAAYVHFDVLGGWDKAALDAYINTNVTNIATAKTALIQLGEELIDLRAICERMAEAVIYLRDVAIRRAN